MLPYRCARVVRRRRRARTRRKTTSVRRIRTRSSQMNAIMSTNKFSRSFFLSVYIIELFTDIDVAVHVISQPHESSHCVHPQIQEAPETVPTGEMPRTMLATVDRTLVGVVAPGSRVNLVGIYTVFSSQERGASDAIRHPYVSNLDLFNTLSLAALKFSYSYLQIIISLILGFVVRFDVLAYNAMRPASDALRFASHHQVGFKKNI